MTTTIKYNDMLQYDDMQILSINSPVLCQLRQDVDAALNKTLQDMQDTDTTEAEITVKLSISMDLDYVSAPTRDALNATREITKPSIAHKVSSVIKIEDSKKGEMPAGYELVRDSKGNYYMCKIGQAQMDMFDINDDVTAAAEADLDTEDEEA